MVLIFQCDTIDWAQTYVRLADKFGIDEFAAVVGKPGGMSAMQHSCA